jgi:NhaP-type Na+/H+ or K+/H+ antiporter
MTRHWKSVFILLVPVMTYGWLVTSLFIWWLIPSLSWLESLCCAACVTATDPVLASSVVGKGKFAKRIPKHLRDLLSAESGCNDGMAFPFIYLALYIIKYRPQVGEVFKHWILLTVLYECVLGSIYGVCVGYVGRHAIKFAEKKNLIDRESFLVFYFVLALWCAGTGSMLGLDDLLVGFCAGVAFSNDGWFSQKTEESHVSNVIDLLLNLAFFVYFGAIIPWSTYNRPDWGITPWRLVVIAIFVILFRRIPIMVLLKPVIKDIKTWREALFAGHFGPIGVGAVFVAILARAELESGGAIPLLDLPNSGSQNFMIVQLIWPITSFLILSSIIVHGSSIAVFTLGKRINTMRITMSYTTANEEPNWLSRLPRLTPRTSMSIRKPDLDESSDEKPGYFPPGTLPPPGGIPGGIPGGFLSRQPTTDDDVYIPSRPANIHPRRKKNWEAGQGPGGPISDTAIAPRRIRSDPLDTSISPTRTPARRPSDDDEELTKKVTSINEYQEGSNIVVENEEGSVIGMTKTSEAQPFNEHLGVNLTHKEAKGPDDLPLQVTDERSAIAAVQAELREEGQKRRERRPAWAYRFDDNIIVEDEDGEVIRRYKLPKERRGEPSRRPSIPWTNWTQKVLGPLKGKPMADEEVDNDNDDAKTVYSMTRDDHDGKRDKPPINFRMHDERGRKLSKQQFLKKLQQMDPHARTAIASADVSADVSTEDLAQRLRVQTGAVDDSGLPTRPQPQSSNLVHASLPGDGDISPGSTRSPGSGRSPKSPSIASEHVPPPMGDERDVETAAERRRREAALGLVENVDSDSDDEEDPSGEGRLEKREKRGGGVRGIRFAELRSPTSELRSPATLTTAEGGISWDGDVKGKKRV